MATSGVQVGFFSIDDNRIRDLAWDSTYIWAINTSGTMKKFTADGVLVDSIAGLLSGGWGLTYGDGYFWASDPNNDMIYKISTVSGVEDENNYVFEKFHLFQNCPNPFSERTSIRYVVASRQEDKNLTTDHCVLTTLKIYELTGRLVRTLVAEPQPPGYYEVIWDGTNEVGSKVAPGIYFYSLRVKNSNITKKMIIMR